MMLYLFAVSFSNPFAFVTSFKFIYKKKKTAYAVLGRKKIE